jgi:hypothetical protein
MYKEKVAADNLLKDLVEVIAEIYVFVVDTQQDLKTGLTDNQKRICRLMLEQTAECGHFISSYVSQTLRMYPSTYPS